MRSRPTQVVVLLAGLTIPRGADAYNHNQHQGIVALGYKAMVAASLEKSCRSPIDFVDSEVPASLRTVPRAYCPTGDTTCETRWATFLDDIDRAIVFFRIIPSSLGLPVPATCPDAHPPGVPRILGTVSYGVDRYYNRDHGGDTTWCGRPAGSSDECASPVDLCEPFSIYRVLAPFDHAGEVLGHWATLPDDDGAVSTVGFKPTNFPGAGPFNELLKKAEKLGLAAVLVPVTCLLDLVLGGDDCVDEAIQVANAGVEALHRLVPVFGAHEDAETLTGLWHYVNVQDGLSNTWDDHQGLFYPEAGPRRVPDALDVGILALVEFAGATLNYEASTGPKRFSIANPGDGDPPSRDRGKAYWESFTLAENEYSPLDNLALESWRRFVDLQTRGARELSGPLHAIGDAVAPHHVVGTTGWGHRPYEEAAEDNWPVILHQDVFPVGEKRRRQYEQLRQILGVAFAYSRRLEALQADRPTSPLNTVPMRAFITEVARDTWKLTTNPITGVPHNPPFDPTVSVPFFLHTTFNTNAESISYSTPEAIALTRMLLERGSGAAVALLVAAADLAPGIGVPAGPRCAADGSGLFNCGLESSCSAQGCCVSGACPNPCQNSDDCPGTDICQSNCCVRGEPR